MILAWLIAVPMIGGILAWWIGTRVPESARWIALATSVLEAGLVLLLLPSLGTLTTGGMAAELRVPWIRAIGATIHLGADTLSIVLIALTAFIGVLSVLCSWHEITDRPGFFFFNLLWSLAAIVGVFTALDLFLFYFFWEMMLIPMYFLIGIWGHERRQYASVKFFIFTQVGGLLMLLSILGLYFIHARTTGVYSFDLADLLHTSMAPSVAMWLSLGFFAAFVVKLPIVPVHTWLPDAHTQAPTAGSVILAALMLKTGAYGLLRFMIPLFPTAAFDIRTIAMILAVAGIIYGALLAYGQRDLKRLVAYTSVSHMGFVLLGIFAWNELALQGAIIQIVCHGLSTGGLFILVGALQERTHTRDVEQLGGIWTRAPRMGGVAMVLAMASLGLPGLGNFVGEMLVLFGTYQVAPAIAVVGTIGLVGATIYSLAIIQRAFHGTPRSDVPVADLGAREMLSMAAIIVALVWIGLKPGSLIGPIRPALQNLQQLVGDRDAAR